ncbi:MAG: diaminopimelate epimerase [Proteobacteria bacterium]|nr:diaminopimelate epimerase [Pseudomonadota bacterium]
MHIEFTKLHGLGNDFLLLEAPAGAALPSVAQWRALADRHAGVGFDQALVLEPPRLAGTAVHYRVFNADGGEVEQSGNGARCVARYLQLRGRVSADGSVLMGSTGGTVAARVHADGRVSVNLGVPDFEPRALPFLAAAAEANYSLQVAGEPIEFGAVSIGNPHAVLRVTAVESAPVERIGHALQAHASFPRQVNVGFMEIVDAAHIRLRVYERGAGETLACGTGACAAVAVGRNLGLLGSDVEVHVPGGRLSVHWQGAGEPVWLTGPAIVAFTGQADI